MRIAAGIMQIISGVFNILVFIGLVIASVFTIGSVTTWFNDIPCWENSVAGAFLVVLAIVFAVAGILSLVGGIFALQRKHWGLALTGSIFTLFPSVIFGILSIIFIAVTRKDFNRQV